MEKSIEIVFVDDEIVIGEMLQICIGDSKMIDFIFYGSQKEFEESYIKTTEKKCHLLISDYNMRGETDGITFLQKNKDRFDKVLLTSSEDCGEKASVVGITFVEKNDLFDFIKSIEGGLSLFKRLKEGFLEQRVKGEKS